MNNNIKNQLEFLIKNRGDCFGRTPKYECALCLFSGVCPGFAKYSPSNTIGFRNKFSMEVYIHSIKLYIKLYGEKALKEIVVESFV